MNLISSRVSSAGRYAAYLAASTLPAPPLRRRWKLRHQWRYRIFEADPDAIRQRLVGPAALRPDEQRRARARWGARIEREWVLANDWDLQVETFDPRSSVAASLAERGTPPDETTLRRLDVAVRAGDPAPIRAAELPEEAEEHLTHIVEIATSIHEEGVRPQRARRRRPTSDEIAVALSREGEPVLLLGGNHRVAIARHLGTPTVPVVVRGVHARWLERLQRVHGSSTRALRRGIQDALSLAPDRT